MQLGSLCVQITMSFYILIMIDDLEVVADLPTEWSIL